MEGNILLLNCIIYKQFYIYLVFLFSLMSSKIYIYTATWWFNHGNFSFMSTVYI